MTIAIFGENSAHCRDLTRRALKTGYTIFLITPTQETSPPHHPHLFLLTGSLHDKPTIKAALKQSDVVICLLDQEPQRANIQNLLSKMSEYDIQRCIFFSQSTPAPYLLQQLYSTPASHVDWTSIYAESNHTRPALAKISQLLINQIGDVRYIKKSIPLTVL